VAGQPSVGHLRDVCRDAAWIESDRALPIGAEVTLAMELPGTGGPIQVAGRVIRLAPGEKAPNGMAILFGELPPAAATRIDFFIALQD
jgi:Tfp pilus assembly protein PilZ